MIYLLGNNLHIHMKIYSFRIRSETYKYLKLKIAQKVIKLYFISVTKIICPIFHQNCIFLQ